MGMSKALKIGFKLWLLGLLASLILIVPYIVLMVVMAVNPFIGLLALIPFALLDFIIIGFILIKFKGWLFR